MARIIVIGAGISGLATAAFLDGADAGGHELLVLEAGPAPGGNVQTLREGGRIWDRAANGWLNSEPAMDRLIARLGLEGQLLPASDRVKVRWIYADGRLHAAPLSPPALVMTGLLTPWSKLRLLAEPFVGRSDPEATETVAAFVSRRLGPQFVDRLVGPMVAGIYAARPDQLSLRAAFPRLWELEQAHGSLIRAALQLRRGGAPPGHLTSLKAGAGQLTEAMAARLCSRLRCGVRVQAIEPRRDGWHVHAEGGSLQADAVVLACPAWAQAAMVRGLDATLAAALEGIPYSPVAVVATAWPQDAWPRPPDGFGALVAPGEEGLGGVLGVLFTSCIFPSHAPPGETLLRTILGGAVHPEALGMDDQQLLAQARAAQARFFGEARCPPLDAKVFRHARGIPLYAPGHRARVRAVRAAQSRHQGLFFTGNHLDGVGVKDCARAGEATALAVASWLDAAPRSAPPV